MFAKSPETIIKFSFFQKIYIFPQNVLDTKNMHFWEPYGKFFVKSLKNLRSESENNYKLEFFQKNIFLKKYSSKKQNFSRKTLSSSLKESLTKLVGGKHGGASRPSCLNSSSNGLPTMIISSGTNSAKEKFY